MQQRVLITGASVGIGRKAAVAFARQGAQVVINYRSAEEDARETQRLVQEAGGTGHLAQADVSDEAAASGLIQEAVRLMGGLDVLVNNAGQTRFIPFDDLDACTAEVWDALYQTNVQSMFFCSRAAAKVMGQGGSIVNVASQAGMAPRGSSIPYCVSKAAIIHLTSCLARVLAPKVRVNCVSPGTIQNTRWNETNTGFDRAAYEAGVRGIALGRLGEPEDIADAIVFLAGAQAGFITGSNLPVEGGALLML